MENLIRTLSATLLYLIFALPLRSSSPGSVPTSLASPVPMFGTSFAWELSIEDAAKKARREGKLILLLHISGFFDNPYLT